MDLMECPNLAVPHEVMQHVVRVESSFNPYAIGVVGGRLVRQPRTLPEAVATARMLENRGYNFSLGLAQVNRYNLAKQGLTSYEQAFQACPNLQAGSRILAECHGRSGNNWGKAFSCYYSGNFVTGYRHGYVQKVFASMQRPTAPAPALAIEVVGTLRRSATPVTVSPAAPAAMTAASARLAMRTASRRTAVPYTPSVASASPSPVEPSPAMPRGPVATGAPQMRTVAVLDAAGGAPELIPAESPGRDTVVASTSPQAPMPDAAFVF